VMTFTAKSAFVSFLFFSRKKKKKKKKKKKQNGVLVFNYLFISKDRRSFLLKFQRAKPQKKQVHTKTTKMNFIDKNKKPANTGGINETVKLAAGKLDGLAGMHEYGDRQKDYTWDCVVFGDGS